MFLTQLPVCSNSRVKAGRQAMLGSQPAVVMEIDLSRDRYCRSADVMVEEASGHVRRLV